MAIENFNIQNIIRFQILNRSKTTLFQNINPEYEHFRTYKNINPDFKIIVTDKIPINESFNKAKTVFEEIYNQWRVHFLEFDDGFVELYITPTFKGVRCFFSYTAAKNLYVRSLLYYVLNKRLKTLVHACAFVLNEKNCLLAGRPGVFKTSILMDAVRKHGASFLGEENTMLSDGYLYSFPLNFNSLQYKIKYLKDENPKNKFEKIKLGFHIIRKKNDNLYKVSNTPTSAPPNIICYLSKADKLEVTKCRLGNIITDLVENEIQEISIPPTHSLSGIKYNHFKEFLEENDPAIITQMRKNLYKMFEEQFAECVCYKISTPHKYRALLTDSIISEINLS